MNTENNTVNITEQVDAAFKEAVSSPVQTTPAEVKWQDPDAYRAATGKRFRMTKEEKSVHGDTLTGRQEAFMKRQLAGLLES